MKCRRYLINVECNSEYHTKMVILGENAKHADEILNRINKQLKSDIKIVGVKGASSMTCECDENLEDQVKYFVVEYERGSIIIVPESEMI